MSGAVLLFMFGHLWLCSRPQGEGNVSTRVCLFTGVCIHLDRTRCIPACTWECGGGVCGQGLGVLPGGCGQGWGVGHGSVDRWPLMRSVRILLECILIWEKTGRELLYS